MTPLKSMFHKLEAQRQVFLILKRLFRAKSFILNIMTIFFNYECYHIIFSTEIRIKANFIKGHLHADALHYIITIILKKNAIL